ncbi:Imm7 family immunity protein [Streptomyces hygroscopicus]|uniref:Imm7 family immunity protein n=1 Tax=Streptomyces hygroscopicus TaxID=1912 RepID=UPI00223FBA4A|nr:Imm7 family immunity protein [Streptomyces hygroscopicus]
MISNEGARLGAEAARLLAQTGLCEFEPGLTDAEFARIEREYGFEFADDHRAFLAAGLPVNVPPEEGQTWSKPWPEWRGGDPGRLRDQLGWPVEARVETGGRRRLGKRRCFFHGWFGIAESPEEADAGTLEEGLVELRAAIDRIDRRPATGEAEGPQHREIHSSIKSRRVASLRRRPP